MMLFVFVIFISLLLSTYYRVCKIRHRLSLYDNFVNETCFYGNDEMAEAYNKQLKLNSVGGKQK